MSIWAEPFKKIESECSDAFGLNLKMAILAETVDFFCGLNLIYKLCFIPLLGEVQLELLLLASRCIFLETSNFVFASLLS